MTQTDIHGQDYYGIGLVEHPGSTVVSTLKDAIGTQESSIDPTPKSLQPKSEHPYDAGEIIGDNPIPYI